MADTPEEVKKREEDRAKRLKSLEEAIRKLTETDDKLVKSQEKRLKEISKTKKQLEGFDDLGKQLQDSLLAPLKGLASSIPAPLRILGKMAIAKPATAFLRAREARLGGGAPAGPAAAGAGPVRHDAFSEAMGREMSQKGYYKGMTAATLAKIPFMGSLAKSWEGKGGIKAKLSGWMGMTTEEGGPGGTNLSKRFLALGTAFYKAGLTKKRGLWVRIVGLDPSAMRENALESGAGGTAMVPAAGKGLATKVKFPFLRFLGLQALFNTIWPWIAKLGLPAAALLLLKPLGIGALGGAVIIWGLWAAWQSISDIITGYKEGGIEGAIEKFLTGEGEGLFNAVKTAAKLGAVFGAAGFLAAGIPGAIAGAIIGVAMGGILGYFGSERIAGWGTKISEALSTMFSWDSAPGWLKGATLGGFGTMALLLTALSLGATVAWPVALAVLLGGMAIGGLTVAAKDIMDSPMDKIAQGLRDEAFKAQESWAERHLWSWMRRAVGMVTGEETTPEQKKMQALLDKRADLIQKRNNQLAKNEAMAGTHDRPGTGGGSVNADLAAWIRTQPGWEEAPDSAMTHNVYGLLQLQSIKKQLEEVSAQITGGAPTAQSLNTDPVQASGGGISITSATNRPTTQRVDKGVSRGDLTAKRGFVIHHTGGGHQTVDDVIGAMGGGTSKKSVHFIIDRNSKTWSWVPTNKKAAHVGSNLTDFAIRNRLSNSTTLGVEIAAKHDNDVTQGQIDAAVALSKHLGFATSQVFKHGELRIGKSSREGLSVIQALRGGLVPPRGLTEAEHENWKRDHRRDLIKPVDIPEMAKGGSLSGAAIVGEAGPELVIGNAEVIPLRFLQEGTLGWWDRIKAFFGLGPERPDDLARVIVPGEAADQVITQRDKTAQGLKDSGVLKALNLDKMAKGGTIGSGIDMSTFVGRNKFFRDASWNDWLSKWGPMGKKELLRLFNMEKDFWEDSVGSSQGNKFYQDSAKKSFLDFVYGFNIKTSTVLDRKSQTGGGVAGGFASKEKLRRVTETIDALGDWRKSTVGSDTWYQPDVVAGKTMGTGSMKSTIIDTMEKMPNLERMMATAGKPDMGALLPPMSAQGGGSTTVIAPTDASVNAAPVTTNVIQNKRTDWAVSHEPAFLGPNF